MPETQLEIVPAETGEPLKRLDVPAIFAGYREELEKWRPTAETLTVTNLGQFAEMKMAREFRLELQALRIAATTRHAELKTDALATCQALDGHLRDLLAVIVPLESRLLQQEEFVEREGLRLQAEREAEAKAAASPDKGKLKAAVSNLLGFEIPVLKSDAGKAIAVELDRRILALAEWLGEQIKGL